MRSFFLLVLLCLMGVQVQAAEPQPATEHVLADGQPIVENEAIRTLHAEAQRIRLRYGLFEQTLDPELCMIAQRWACHMAGRRSMYHGGGEQIIAMGSGDLNRCFSIWMNSSPHRGWVLSRTALCGYGCQKSSNGQWYWAGVFRDRRGNVSVEVKSVDTK